MSFSRASERVNSIGGPPSFPDTDAFEVETPKAKRPTFVHHLRRQPMLEGLAAIVCLPSFRLPSLE